MPLFTSFDDAWAWFVAGGELVGVEEAREWFTQGRAQFLAFQAPVSDPPALDEIEEIQEALPASESIILMEREALHISILGVGYQVITKTKPDEVLRQDVPRIAEHAARTLRGQKPIDASIGPINVFPDALVLEVDDPGSRLASIRGLLSEETGGDAFQLEDPEHLPHITIATFRDASAGPLLRDALEPLRGWPPIAATLRRIELSRWWFTGDDMTETPERDVVRSYVLR